jgi:polyhydroxybutyrate depolymerase
MLLAIQLLFASIGISSPVHAGIHQVHLPVKLMGVPAFPERKEARVYLPVKFSSKRSWPLVVLLHGYSSSARLQELYMMLSKHVSAKEFVLLVPEGTTDAKGNRFWNATDFCCDFEQRGVRDSEYLQALIEAASSRYSIDADRVYLFGHSNGGFMANRLACEVGSRIAGIATLAGTTYKDPSRCQDRNPIPVLHAHGTGDETIFYSGDPRFPGAEEYLSYWSDRNGCSDMTTQENFLDLSPLVHGAETDVLRGRGCQAELVHWRMEGVGHIPFLRQLATERALDFLLRQRRLTQPLQR